MSTDDRNIKLDVDKYPLPERVQSMLAIGRKLNKGKVTLRVTPTLCILVKPENCNEEYAKEYREKINSCMK